MKKPAKSTHHAAVNTPTNSNRNTAPVVIDTPQKQQTAKEAIAANVQLLIEQLEQGHSEGLTAYLTAMGRFHNYSIRQHYGDCAAEAGRDPRCWTVCVEPA
jgi:hypothetical protein